MKNLFRTHIYSQTDRQTGKQKYRQSSDFCNLLQYLVHDFCEKIFRIYYDFSMRFYLPIECFKIVEVEMNAEYRESIQNSLIRITSSGTYQYLYSQTACGLALILNQNHFASLPIHYNRRICISTYIYIVQYIFNRHNTVS